MIPISKGEYMIKGDSIILPKKTLEGLISFYSNIWDSRPFEQGIYAGKREAFIDLLKLFKE